MGVHIDEETGYRLYMSIAQQLISLRNLTDMGFWKTNTSDSGITQLRPK
jgi:hypothetical protein